jgi:hypothetical protein
MACGMFSGKEFGPLGFSCQGEYISGRTMSGGGLGGHTPGGAAKGGLRHPMVWLASGPPPALLWTPSSCQVIRDFGFCFPIPKIFPVQLF